MLGHQKGAAFKRSDARPEGRLDLNRLPLMPTVALFERYGICGSCETVCSRGLISISDLTRHDKIITRKGLRSAKFLMVNLQDGNAESSPKTILMNSLAMGNDLPNKPIAVGCNNSVVRYFSSKKNRHPSRMTVDMSGIKAPDFIRDYDISELCIIVFAEAVEVLVQGVYILCPGENDVRGRLCRTNNSLG